MIVSTIKADALLRKALGKGQSMVMPPQKLVQSLELDPTLANPTREAYIITNEDLSASKIRQEFESKVQYKHPKVRVIFINKSAKPMYENGLPGIDVVLQKPSAKEVADAIATVVNTDTISETTYNAPVVQDIPEYRPEAPVYEVPTEEVPQEEIQQEPDFELPPVPQYVEPTPEEVPEDLSSNMVAQIKAAGSVSDISVLAREINAQEMIKDLINSNSTYAGIEDKLKITNDMIYAIMSDPTNKSLDDKLSKIRALLHDKAFYHEKGDSLIEERLEQIIDTIISQTQSVLNNRLTEIDTAIKHSKVARDVNDAPTRFAGLNEERANLLIELTKLQTEITDIFKSSDSIIMDTASKLAEDAENLTGNEVMNTHLRARGTAVISEETKNAIAVSLELAKDKLPDAFEKMRLDIVTLIEMLGKLFDVDKEIIAAQQYITEYMKSNNIENTVVAQSLLKKSLRVFIGENGTGKSIIPYLCSKYKSRQNANVLLLDLTGSNKYDDYDIHYQNVDEYFSQLNEEHFHVVVGTLENNVANAQRVVTTLLKAADYYSAINVVLTPDQRELFETISKDVLCVNFIMDTIPEHIDNAKNIIAGTNWTNIAKRIIVNKCEVPVSMIIKRLGLEDSMDFQICTVGTVPALIDARLAKYDPYGISSVDLAIEELIKYA